MNEYSFEELADIHLVYGRAGGNGRLATRIYQETFPGRRIPNHQTFAAVDRRLRETGQFRSVTANYSAPRTVRTSDVEERILDQVNDNPSTSTRKIAAAEHLSHMTVWRVLHEQLLYPYHLQRVQGLSLADFPARLMFSQWFLQQCVDPIFESSLLFTDEAGFNRDGIINFHNNHLWADENPHGIVQSRHQQQFSLNVWAGIIGDHLIGPYFLPARLTGEAYRDFLENQLPGLLEDVLLPVRQRMWYMHDGAPPHFSRTAREFLNATYPGRWIGRGGPIPWPARSPDMNPLDFFFWGCLKTLVYSIPVPDLQSLRQRIEDGCDIIRNTPGIFQQVRQSMRRRAQVSLESNGGHFEHLL